MSVVSGRPPRGRTLLAFCLTLLMMLPAAVNAQRTAGGPRTVETLADGWRFHRGEATGAEQPGFDDAAWNEVSVPHDWSIAGPVAENNPSGAPGGYFPDGVGWYRRQFTLAPGDLRRHVFVVLDGVMANSDVWVNGFHLGHRPNGYVSLIYDLTGHLRTGADEPNMLAVRCDNSRQPASRWYEGAGIYRGVRLVITDAVHFDPWSVVITTPSISDARATVHVGVALHNESSAEIAARVVVRLMAPDGSTVAKATGAVQALPAGSVREAGMDLSVPQPKRWTLEQPAMYRASVSLQVGHATVDDQQVLFGIREFHFDADKGFFLNGKNFKLYGAALHMDGGAVGIAVPAAIYRGRLLALKAMGVNAIRTAHNPPSPEFLDQCDQLGLLVMEEMFDVWTVGKEPYDYHLYFRDWAVRDLTNTVRRDRNHPSIILWSAGNEIHDTPRPEIAKPILASLVRAFHENDPTRPVTQALFRPNVSHDYDDGLADMLDVVGQNYRTGELLAAHAAKPSRKILGTENTHDRDQWLALRDHPEFSGEFIWTGIDYLGEAGRWPSIGTGFGFFDRTLHAEPRGLERESWWSAKPVVHIVRRIARAGSSPTDPGYEPLPTRSPVTALADWTPEDQRPHMENVEVYTNGDEADLLLNGKSLGRQRLHADASPLVWQVPFAAGTLQAISYRKGQQVAQETLQTAGTATHLVLHAARGEVTASASDLVAVEAFVEDAHGTVVPGAAATLHFDVTGAGVLVATDSGSNVDHVPFPSPDRAVRYGRAIAYVRATSPRGKLRVTVASDGLASASATLTATPPTPAAVEASF